MSSFFTIRQGMAGYYNGLGDYYTASGEPMSATAYYQLALEREFQNHKSNYALASLARSQNNQPATAYYFRQALLKQPAPQDYAGLSQAYLQNNLFFDAIKVLQKGIRAFPESGELQNNLGYLYGRTSIADSAYYYFKSATRHADRTDIPESNLLGFYALNPVVLQADSTLAKNIPASAYESYQANALALRLVARNDTSQPAKPDWLARKLPQSGLSTGQFASLYNYSLVKQQPDSTELETVREAAGNPANQDLTDDLLLARAVVEYKCHNPTNAFGLINQLVENEEENKADYRSIAGLWMLDQGLYRQAASMFGYNTDTASVYLQAVALTKANDPILAQSRWEMVAKSDPAANALRQFITRNANRQPTWKKHFT